MNPKKTISILIIAGALIWSILNMTYKKNYRISINKNTESLSFKINEDIKRLIEDEKFEKIWNEVLVIKYSINSSKIREILKKEKIIIQTNPSGRYLSEFNFIQAEDNDPEIILQISIFDKKTLNKLYEWAWIYDLSDKNSQIKKKPDRNLSGSK